jgi:hypothetical protein
MIRPVAFRMMSKRRLKITEEVLDELLPATQMRKHNKKFDTFEN